MPIHIVNIIYVQGHLLLTISKYRIHISITHTAIFSLRGFYLVTYICK